MALTSTLLNAVNRGGDSGIFFLIADFEDTLTFRDYNYSKNMDR